MRNLVRALFVVLAGVAGARGQVQTVPPRPLQELVTVRQKPLTAGTLEVPVITWGGDVATVVARDFGFFKEAGLAVSLFAENDLTKQVQGFLDGRTPFLRGTLGMMNASAEAIQAAGLDLVVVYQMTFSAGGDCLVVRENIRTPGDLRGKTLAVQLHGPHMDYLTKILTDAGVGLDEVTVRWFKELTLPTYDTGGKAIDPVSAFRADASIDAVFCISPDAGALTSGSVGTGAENSVKGARTLVSTKSASRIIADVYAVRRDWYDQNRPKVRAFVHALLRAEEALRDLIAQKAAQQAKYQQVLTASADLLMGASQATADVEGMLGDCEFTGFQGNVGFFTGQGTLRTFTTLCNEIQPAFIDLKLMGRRVPLAAATWDSAELAKGLKYAGAVAAAPKFDAGKAAARVESEIAAEPEKWGEEGTLFVVEINFAPNQSAFSTDQYGKDFRAALEKAQTYGGALIVIEGHSDPTGVADARKKGLSEAVVAQKEQSAKNLSLTRARAVRQSFLDYCKANGLVLDETQFVAVGLGVKAPKFPEPRTESEWAQNRRVVFRVKNMEAEATEFKPAGR
jgi:ABC-type nitrate/sulfonate/bicarbonate transport system substrate-binding protein/outer membrane protein OmpA-like peptidoglycan-associated protein